jgi:hypothetical protein
MTVNPGHVTVKALPLLFVQLSLVIVAPIAC